MVTAHFKMMFFLVAKHDLGGEIDLVQWVDVYSMSTYG